MRRKTLYLACGIIVIFVLISAGISVVLQLNNVPGESDLSDELFSSIVYGGNYLVNVTNTDGSFIYEYNAASDTENEGYNILRHAGTVYSMLQVYDETGDTHLLTAAESAIEFLLSFLKPFDNGSSQVIVYQDEVKLGGNALAIIALAEHAKVTDNKEYVGVMQGLAKFIEFSQKDSGEFISKRYYSTGIIDSFVSQYYPGEAILALCRLYSLDGNETWLDVAEKATQYLIDQRKNIETVNLVHDHWLLMAMNELYRFRDNSSYFTHSMDLAESIMYQQRDGVNRISEQSEWLGSYYTPPGTTSTATRSEALVAAYHLSNDFGERNMTEKILNAVDLGVKFQLTTQFTPDNIQSLPNPSKAVGGFHNTLTDYTIRIDYVQHNICSILGYYRII